jgi:cytochrome d ubiquinol oxidase subunit I
LQGLDAFEGRHPPVAPVFWSFRVMVGLGLLMLVVSWTSAGMMYRTGADKLPRVLLWTLSAMTFSGWVATLAGWYVTEIGRQPWIVYGMLRTADVVADHAPGTVVTTLVAYLTVYALLLLAYIGVLKYMAEHPTSPAPLNPGAQPVGSGTQQA